MQAFLEEMVKSIDEEVCWNSFCSFVIGQLSTSAICIFDFYIFFQLVS